MGTKKYYECADCGFEWELFTKQPSYVFSGSIIQKYCPKTQEITSVCRSILTNEVSVSCIKNSDSEKIDSTSPCFNCNGDCLQDLEVLSWNSAEHKDAEAYKCPHCGNILQNNHRIIIFAD